MSSMIDTGVTVDRSTPAWRLTPCSQAPPKSAVTSLEKGGGFGQYSTSRKGGANAGDLAQKPRPRGKTTRPSLKVRPSKGGFDGDIHEIRSQLSGNAGSWTNSDDVNRRQRRAQRMQQAILAVPKPIGPTPKMVKGMVKQALVNAGVYGGAGVATALGMPQLSGALSALGGNAGRRISKLIGTGDYEANDVALSSTVKPGVKLESTFGGNETECVVSHREFIGDINTGPVAGTFSNNSFPINPGLRRSFPWLSQASKNWECYEFLSLVYELIPTSSPYNSNSSMGTGIATVEYNATADLFTSKTQMENSNAAVSARFDKGLIYGVECKKGYSPQGCYYIRSGDIDTPTNLTDLGNFQIATAPASTFPLSTTVYELYVTYRVKLSKPRLSNANSGYAHFSRTGVATATPLGTTSVAANVGGVLTGATCNSVGFTLNSSFGDQYLVMIQWKGTVSATTAMPGRNTEKCSRISMFANTGSTTTDEVAMTGTSQFDTGYTTALYTSNNTPATSSYFFNTTGGVFPSGTTTCDVFVIFLGNGINAVDL